MNEEIKSILNNMVTVKNYEGAVNQFLIIGDDFTLLQSYRSPIVMLKDGQVYLFEDWDYSQTTSKYRNMFLGETTKETQAKLNSGEYIGVWDK